MSDFIVVCAPAPSHVAPLITIARHLHRSGHRVRMITGRLFEDRVRAAGPEFVPLPPECDFDDRDLDAVLPGRAGLKGMDRLRFDIDHYFLDGMRPQRRVLDEQIRRRWPDAILADPGYTGVLPLLQTPSPRPPVVTAGIVPFQFGSRDTAPFGTARPPSATPLGRLRNRLLTAGVQWTFRRNQAYANRLLEQEGAAPLRGFIFDAVTLGDVYLQFCTASLEYPRSDLPSHVRFVGPILPEAEDTGVAPGSDLDGWRALPGSGPVVLVTQGTVDNTDLGRLLGPTLQGLRDLDVRVIATTGGRSVTAIPVPVPANAWATEFVPFADVLPHVDVVVTNGGYGGVNQALAHGIPLVVAGDTEDKAEVGARVAWTGAGLRLRNGDPDPQTVRSAVQRVLADGRFRASAERIAADIRRSSPLTSAAEALVTAQVRRDVPVATTSGARSAT